ncbi:Nuclease-related domain-containing protein [Alkalibacterium subtropicum]|uniref:Nuclease-related domain-containing protein n=1 Tax=Alkalibacterium subtropicum TaxID=753702 RepID=A0A1I1LDC0_9LACT|nr:nuclease-related domain-containing protein [Alkalibacterium subtropicum]SFC70512.1 Nuclease-related domain-containing protein [Alkalibacterium subtropicum]
METVKARTQPELLKILKILDKRMALPVKHKQHILSMEKGYEGEKLFDSLLETYLEAEVLVLNDLLLKVNDQSAQIDSLVITPETVYLYEIKNYRGDYQMKDRQLLTLSGKEIGNPLTQLTRTTSLLRQLFHQWHADLAVEGAVLYVNPTFTLYHASPKDPLILPTQISRHLKKLDSQRVALNRNHRYLADRLLSKHRTDANFHQLIPQYDYQSLRKGITCLACGSFDIQLKQRMSYCEKCEYSCSTDDMILEQIKEFKLLFPQEKVTVKKINDWCGSSVTRRRIPRILGQYYSKTGLSTGTHYV